MNSKHRFFTANGKIRAFVVVALSLTLFSSIGCKPDTAKTSTEAADNLAGVSGSGRNPQWNGQQIIEKMKATYSAAGAYHDEAVLRLSYRLAGSYLEEPHQWAVEFRRPNELRASVYNARLRADGEQVGCFVYDFGSSNLGNQWLVTRIGQSFPLGKLTRDPICRYYLSGLADLPVDGSNAEAGEWFLPPQIPLLTGAGNVSWLQGKATRIEDRVVSDRPCYQVNIDHPGGRFLAIIDCESLLLKELHYPLAALDPRLSGSNEVTDLQIVAEFRNATLEPAFAADHFRIEMPEEAIPVNQFVKVPEQFPSSFVGKPVELAGLIELNGAPVDRSRWKGKVVFLGWTSNMMFDERWNRTIADLAESMDTRDYIVASAYAVSGAGPGSDVLQGLNTSVSTSSKALAWVDPSFVAGSSIGLETFPVFAILDRAGVLQYVGRIGETAHTPSLEELRSILLRVRSGDDVAGEMRNEYGKFLEVYESRLASARLDGEAASGNSILPESPPEKMKLRKRWEVRELRQPGNIACGAAGKGLWVVDGWRTLVALDNEGKSLSETPLALPAKESITLARPSETRERIATFSVAGRHVHIIDNRANIVGRVYREEGEARVRDARLADLDNDGTDELYIAWTSAKGVTRHLPGEEGDWPETTVLNTSWLDSCLLRSGEGENRLLVCDENARLALATYSAANGTLSLQPVSCSLESCVRVASGVDKDGHSIACVAGTDRLGRWHVALLDAALKEMATLPTGPQNFSSQIDPIAFARVEGTAAGLWAVAGSNGAIRLISEDGSTNETWSIGQAIEGLTLCSAGESIVAVVSGDQTLQAFELLSSSMRH